MDLWNITVDEVHRILSSMGIRDIIEILIIAFLVYHILVWIQSMAASERFYCDHCLSVDCLFHKDEHYSVDSKECCIICHNGAYRCHAARNT